MLSGLLKSPHRFAFEEKLDEAAGEDLERFFAFFACVYADLVLGILKIVI